MKVLDPGHWYALKHLDGNEEEFLTFVKRAGAGYPGNADSYEGTNIQEVLRALIDRLKYLHRQVPHSANVSAINHLRHVLKLLDDRAAERHGRPYPEYLREPELEPFCDKCGHIGCKGECHQCRD